MTADLLSVMAYVGFKLGNIAVNHSGSLLLNLQLINMVTKQKPHSYDELVTLRAIVNCFPCKIGNSRLQKTSTRLQQ